MKTGSIYVYAMPGFERDVYVGSTQDGNTMRRHREHLRSKRSLGQFLRWYLPDRVPQPREVERVDYENVDELLKREFYWQKKLGVMVVDGGYNQTAAWPAVDHSLIGKIGGAKGGKASVSNGHPAKADGWRRVHRKYPEMAARAVRHMNEVATYDNLAKGARRRQELYPTLSSETAKKTHEKYPWLAAYRGRRTHELHPDHTSKIGILSCHRRWHLARGIVSLKCSLCRQESNGSSS